MMWPTNQSCTPITASSAAPSVRPSALATNAKKRERLRATQPGEQRARLRPDPAPDEERFGRLLDQHAEAIAGAGSRLFRRDQKRRLAPVHHVVRENAAAQQPRRQRRRL